MSKDPVTMKESKYKKSRKDKTKVDETAEPMELEAPAKSETNGKKRKRSEVDADVKTAEPISNDVVMTKKLKKQMARQKRRTLRAEEEAAAKAGADDAEAEEQIEVLPTKSKKDKKEKKDKKDKKAAKSEPVAEVNEADAAEEEKSATQIKKAEWKAKAKEEKKKMKEAKKAKKAEAEDKEDKEETQPVQEVFKPVAAEPAVEPNDEAVEPADLKKSQKKNLKRKEKRAAKANGEEPTEGAVQVPVEADDADSKKARKSKKKKSKAAVGEEGENDADEAEPSAKRVKTDLGPQEVPPKKVRFIAFIGNLPYTATKEDVSKHFASVRPDAVRLMTHKDTGKSKGFAFIEFEAYDRMKTCLKLYHHSNFEDGKGEARRINVELTAGGGGNTDARKNKILEKNDKLRDERQRNFTGSGVNAEKPAEGATPKVQNEHADIHPSRMAQMAPMRR
ncbi:hypothetical protein BT63DRAFT_420382 [Microthyrium microscopicum]|uniref:RRM domain-containing protein n=1 Tax=Microthyrium microscopicum TaxID=703497 RepID=A0A6A6US57_9PEZI|nr:hypothetical protein BT63DRAFT_420382 [Microthyrium microscopicum]